MDGRRSGKRTGSVMAPLSSELDGRPPGSPGSPTADGRRNSTSKRSPRGPIHNPENDNAIIPPGMTKAPSRKASLSLPKGGITAPDLNELKERRSRLGRSGSRQLLGRNSRSSSMTLQMAEFSPEKAGGGAFSGVVLAEEAPEAASPPPAPAVRAPVPPGPVPEPPARPAVSAPRRSLVPEVDTVEEGDEAEEAGEAMEAAVAAAVASSDEAAADVAQPVAKAETEAEAATEES